MELTEWPNINMRYSQNRMSELGAVMITWIGFEGMEFHVSGYRTEQKANKELGGQLVNDFIRALEL